MSDQQKSTNRVSEEQNVRPDMVNTAVNFLLNLSVINKPNAHKTAFLKKKGLTDAEISLAYKRAESNPKYDEILRNSNASKNLLALSPPMPIYRKPVSFWSHISRFSSSLIVLGVALFGAHYIYKTYIEPLLFGEESQRRKSQNLEKQLLEMANSLSQLEKQVSSLEENIKGQKGQMDKFFHSEVNEYYPTPIALRELKSEIASVKSMLLNRHQFPALPKVTPAIPQWQLPSTENDEDTVKQNGEAGEDQYSDEHKSSGSKSPFEINSEEDDDTSKRINDPEAGIKNLEESKSQPEYSEELSNDSPLL